MGPRQIRLIAAAIAAAVVLLGVATHFLLPPYLAARVEERLEEHGGRAEVTLRAVPALRLLAGHGDRIEIEGSGLEYDLADPDRDAFDRLDRFDAVRVDLRDVTAGPFETARFRLESTGGGTDGAKRYAIEIDARASPRDLAAVAGEQFGDLGRLLGEIAGGAIPFGAASVPLRLDGQLESRDGEVEMVAGTAAVAGVPAGPLARIVTDAILSRL